MKVSKVKVYDIDESVKASKYPMALDTDVPNSLITNTVIKLAQSKKGEGHDQFLTGCLVAFDLTCSNKMWVEMERYRFVYFVSSQSTMHRAGKFDIASQCNNYVDKCILRRLNKLQQQYIDDPTSENYLTLLYNIPSGFELTARLTTNYRSLKTIYSQRKDHRLPEWREFCEWIKSLPNSELIIGEEKTPEAKRMDIILEYMRKKMIDMSEDELKSYLENHDQELVDKNIIDI